MTKGDDTRQAILEQAAQVFNQRGYFGTSMDDLMRATNLTKGGIYNHFGSKEALAIEAFEYALERVHQRFRETLGKRRTTRSRLEAFITMFRLHIDDPLFDGGCPVLNTAIEADDTNPALLERAQLICEDWQNFIIRTVNKGIELGDVPPDTDGQTVASVIIATLEGGIMLSKLYGDERHVHRVVEHIQRYVESFTSKP
jgi:AcrR family transcriptional regulator